MIAKRRVQSITTGAYTLSKYDESQTARGMHEKNDENVYMYCISRISTGSVIRVKLDTSETTVGNFVTAIAGQMKSTQNRLSVWNFAPPSPPSLQNTLDEFLAKLRAPQKIVSVWIRRLLRQFARGPDDGIARKRDFGNAAPDNPPRDRRIYGWVSLNKAVEIENPNENEIEDGCSFHLTRYSEEEDEWRCESYKIWFISASSEVERSSRPEITR